MPVRPQARKWRRKLALTLALVSLAGCAGTYVPKAEPSFYRDLAIPGNELDAAAAASMISGYRANNGLTPVTLDPELMQLAQAQAALMAKRDKLDHDAGKPFVARLKASGYDAKTAAENIGAGYHTLAEAFSGWRDSPPHRANMLLKGATRMGIAAVYHAGVEIQSVLGADHRRAGRARRAEASLALDLGARTD